MALDTVKIPQNVYVEERIVGPITLRQIIIVMAGGGISYVLFSSFKAAGSLNIATMVFSWVPALIAAAFAFVKINDISLFRLMLLMIEKAQKPGVRAWRPRTGITINISVKKSSNEHEKQAPAESGSQKHIKELSALLDSEKEELAKEAAEEQAKEAMQRQSEESTRAATGPVDPSRVGVEPLMQSIDTLLIPDAKKETPQPSQTILRDLHPPAS